MQKINRNSLGQFMRSRERMVHLSAPIIRNPEAAIAEAMKVPFSGPKFIVQRPGHTYRKPAEAA